MACVAHLPLHGQAPAAQTADTTRLEFEQLVSDYDAQEKAVETEIHSKIVAAQSRYTADLEALAGKLEQSKRTEEAKQVRAELKRFAAHGLNGEPAKTAPPALRTPWSTLLHETAAINESVALKRSSLRTKFEQNLTGLERINRTKNDTEGVALVERARATLSIRRSIEADGFTATQVVSKNPDWWQDVAREGGYIVGFEAGKGSWFQFSVLGDMKPVFMTMHGLRDGEPRGNAKGERVTAKEGYAVGGLLVCSGDVVNTAKIIFMRINPDGVSLNAQDAYTSDWLGGEAKGLKPVEINPRGHLIIGVTGASGDIVDSLGLIYLK